MNKLVVDMTEAQFEKEIEGAVVVQETTDYTDYIRQGQEFAVFRKFAGGKIFKLLHDLPKEVACAPCGVKILTRDNPEKCPVCGVTHQDNFERNTKMEQEFQAFKTKIDEEATTTCKKKHQELLYKYELITEDIYTFD